MCASSAPPTAALGPAQLDVVLEDTSCAAWGSDGRLRLSMQRGAATTRQQLWRMNLDLGEEENRRLEQALTAHARVPAAVLVVR